MTQPTCAPPDHSRVTLMPSVGFRILPLEHRVSADLVRQFDRIPVANVSDSMHRMTAAGAALRPIHATGRLAGPAFTVKVPAGDNLMIHKALDLARAGDVLVVDGGGDLTRALVGELLVAYAASRHLAGMVLNGAIRDFHSLSRGHFPVFAAGVTHRGPGKSGPGEINVAIAIDGMVIEPGDLILGDEDGVLSVPRAFAPEILQRARAIEATENQWMADIQKGLWNRAWVDDTLGGSGYTP